MDDVRPETKQARDDYAAYQRRIAENEPAGRARGAADPALDPDMTPSNPRLQPFYDRSVREQSRFIGGEITREQFAANLYEIAARCGVTHLVPWRGDFDLPGPNANAGAAAPADGTSQGGA